jgi:hypothetical protein
MNLLTALTVSALAVWEIVEIWHHSQLFAGRRAWLEAQDNKIADLLLCPFCLSVWVSLIVLLIVGTSVHLEQHAPRWMIDCIRLPIYVFAVARLANLFNDMTRNHCRTPRDTDWLSGDDGEHVSEDPELDDEDELCAGDTEEV